MFRMGSVMDQEWDWVMEDNRGKGCGIDVGKDWGWLIVSGLLEEVNVQFLIVF